MSKTARSAKREPERPEAEDTIMRRLSPKVKDRMGVDAWEPSLLRKMLRVRDAKSGKATDL